MDDLLHLQARVKRRRRRRNRGGCGGKRWNDARAMEFVISRLADRAELAIRSRVLINNEVLLSDR